jgi:hypothetical protein
MADLLWADDPAAHAVIWNFIPLERKFHSF